MDEVEEEGCQVMRFEELSEDAIIEFLSRCPAWTLLRLERTSQYIRGLVPHAFARMESLELSEVVSRFWNSSEKIQWLVNVILRCGRALKFIYCDINVLVRVWLEPGFPEALAARCPHLEVAFIPFCREKALAYQATLSYAEAIPGGSHFKRLRLTSVTEQDTEFYERLLVASPRVEFIELSARLSYEWVTGVLKNRKHFSNLKSLTLFINERAMDDVIDIVQASPKLSTLTINGFMHEEVNDESFLIRTMTRLAAKLPFLDNFKIRSRTHVLPNLVPILGHLITELVVDGGDEHVFVTGIDERMARLEKLTLSLRDSSTLQMLLAQLPNTLRVLDLYYNCEDQSSLMQFIHIRGPQLVELTLNCPLLINQRALLFEIANSCVDIQNMQLGLLSSIPYMIKNQDNEQFSENLVNDKAVRALFKMPTLRMLSIRVYKDAELLEQSEYLERERAKLAPLLNFSINSFKRFFV